MKFGIITLMLRLLKESEICHEWSISSVFKPSLEERTPSISMYHRHQAPKLVLDCRR